MSNNASSDFDVCRKPDNPQETLEESNFYFAGLCAGEMTCSVIKAANYNPVGRYYFAIDFTVSNADKRLLQEVNRVVMQGGGVISPIKGAYNVSARGKKRVSAVLAFFDRYPIIVGDLAKNRVALLRKAHAYLATHRGKRMHNKKSDVMDNIRKKLRLIKTQCIFSTYYPQERVSNDARGYFLAGVLDGEGSFGFKKSGNYQQPFFNVAMKDRKIIQLFRDFLKHGNVRRRTDGLYHYEINHPEVLKDMCSLFLAQYPLRHARQRKRLMNLQRILNDYTRNSLRMIVGE